MHSTKQWAFNNGFKNQVLKNKNSKGAYRQIGSGTVLGDYYYWAKYPPGVEIIKYKGEGGLRTITEQVGD